jgi:hypothetical protein
MRELKSKPSKSRVSGCSGAWRLERDGFFETECAFTLRNRSCGGWRAPVMGVLKVGAMVNMPDVEMTVRGFFGT